MTTQTLEREAMKLRPASRLRLAEKLMDSVDDFVSGEVADAWNVEISRRVREIETGSDPGVLGEEVHAEARRRLREARRISSARNA